MPQVVGIDHVYVTCSDLARSEAFYDRLLTRTLGFRQGGRFRLGSEEHVSYFNQHFGFVLRPARAASHHDSYSPGVHHFCFRVDSEEDVRAAALALQREGLEATAARCYPEYASDYIATFLEDPDGLRLEITNYRQERRERHDHWAAPEALGVR